MARLPQPFRDITLHAEIRNAVIIISINCAILLSLTALASFGRQNWARWTLLLLFVAQELAPFGIALYMKHAYPAYHPYHTIGEFWHYYVRQFWSRPSNYIGLASKVVLIALIFSPNARPWFKRKTAAA